MRKPTLFLGGSTDYRNYYNWRKDYLEQIDNIDLFDPYVKNWNDEARKNEDFHRENDDYLLFTISGANIFSIAELIDCSNKRHLSTIAVFDYDSIKQAGLRVNSFKAVEKMVVLNGAKAFTSHEDCIAYLKSIKEIA